MKKKLADLITLLLVGIAAVVTGVVVRHQFFSYRMAEPHPS
jgi:hypothetical protein